MKHYAVFGHPVAHSLSPRIHAAFGRETGIGIDYQQVIKGLVLLGAVCVDVYNQRR